MPCLYPSLLSQASVIPPVESGLESAYNFNQPVGRVYPPAHRFDPGELLGLDRTDGGGGLMPIA